MRGRPSCAVEAGEDGGDFFVRGEATGVGVGKATIDTSEFGIGGVVFACREGGFDLGGVGSEFGLGLGGPGDGAGEGVSERMAWHWEAQSQ